MQAWKLRTSEEVRAEVERRLRWPVSAEAWGFVTDPSDQVRDAVSQVFYESSEEGAEEALGIVIGEVRRFERHAPRATAGAPAAEPERIATPVGQLDPALKAHAQLAAREARSLPEVVAFRRQVLRGRLVPPAEVGPWCQRRGIPAGKRWGPTLKQVMKGAPNVQPLWIYWPARPHAKGIRCRPGTALARLRELAQELAARFGWWEAAAVAFVLADVAPRPRAVFQSSYRDGPWPPLTNRITLEVHPSLTGRQVAAVYQQARAFVGRGSGRGHVRRRQGGRRSWPELAAFVLEANDGRLWREALTAWNAGPARGRPTWRYERVETFIGHARRAVEHSTGAPLAWRGRGAQRVKKAAAARRAHKMHTFRRKPA